MKFEVTSHRIGLQRLPWATLALGVAALAVFALAGNGAASPLTHWGVEPRAFGLEQALGHIFFHAHGVQLASALAILFLFGAPLEEHLGALLWVPLTVLGALAAAASYAAFAPAAAPPLVGMSGATAALVGAALVRFRGGWPLTAYALGSAGAQSLRLCLPALAIFPVGCAFELAGFMALGKLGAATALWGPLGGFLCGGIAAGLVEWTSLERRVSGSGPLDRRAGPHPAIEASLRAQERANLNEALAILDDAVRGGAHDPDLILHYWELASAAGKPQQAAKSFQSLIEKELASGRKSDAALYWCELLGRVQEIEAPTRLLLQLAPELIALERRDETARTLRAAACSSQLTPGMALRVVDLAGEIDPPSTLRAARIALTSPDLHEAKRARLEQLARELSDQEVCELDSEPGQQPAPAASAPCATERDPGEAAQPGATREAVGEASAPGEAVDIVEPPVPEFLQASERAPASDGEPASDGLDLDDVPTLSGLSLHGLDLETEELEAVGSLVDEMPSTAVDLGSVDGPESDLGAEAQDSAAQASAPPAPPGLENEGADGTLDVLDAIGLGIVGEAPRFSDAKIIEAIPTALEAQRLGLQQFGGKRGHVEYARVDAISVAAIEGLADKPVVLLDMLANWTALAGGVLRLIRLRSDQFDARELVPDAADGVQAFKLFAQILLERCSAVALPDPQAAVGQPFRVCADLAQYEREILQLDR